MSSRRCNRSASKRKKMDEKKEDRALAKLVACAKRAKGSGVPVAFLISKSNKTSPDANAAVRP